MAKHRKQNQLTGIHNAPMGQSAAVNRSIEMRPDGESVMAISLDIGSAPAPERKYLAEIASVAISENSIKLLFGQNKITAEIRNLLIVDISPTALHSLLRSVEEIKSPSYEDVVNMSGVKPQSLTDIKTEPEQTIALKANLISTCANGYDACFDFYYLSPFATLKLASSDKVDIDPVVRVDIQTGLFMAILNELKKVAKVFPPPEEGKNEKF